MDPLKGVQAEAPSTKESNVRDENGGRVIQLSDIASLVAVVSVGTYVIGLFVFWYPISIKYTDDFATAWYATSLVFRNVIVGHGVQELLIPYGALLLFLGAALLVAIYVATSPRLGDRPVNVRILVFWSLMLLLLFVGGELLKMYYLGPANYRLFFPGASQRLHSSEGLLFLP